jgi:1-aminocyclopropane-1-carboxylate deaminase/D-cysteine desulfhydrase-like pyridoxal-dependent ACC family enzyme
LNETELNLQQKITELQKVTEEIEATKKKYIEQFAQIKDEMAHQIMKLKTI